MHELRVELLAHKLKHEQCEERKRNISKYSTDPTDLMANAIDALTPNKKHVFKRYGSGIKKGA